MAVYVHLPGIYAVGLLGQTLQPAGVAVSAVCSYGVCKVILLVKHHTQTPSDQTSAASASLKRAYEARIAYAKSCKVARVAVTSRIGAVIPCIGNAWCYRKLRIPVNCRGGGVY